jgi:hypothetical protein
LTTDTPKTSAEWEAWPLLRSTGCHDFSERQDKWSGFAAGLVAMVGAGYLKEAAELYQRYRKNRHPPAVTRISASETH